MTSAIPTVLEGSSSSTLFSNPSLRGHDTPHVQLTQPGHNSPSHSQPFFDDTNPYPHHSGAFERGPDTYESPAAREPVTPPPESVASHVPSPEPALTEGNVLDGTGPHYHERPQESIDAVVSRIRFHLDKPMERLPALTARELRSIGQCISLSIATKVNGTRVRMYYTGVICSVSKTTLVLAHVNRYTDLDFATFLHREEAAVSGSSDMGSRSSPDTKTLPFRAAEEAPLEVMSRIGAGAAGSAAAPRQRAAGRVRSLLGNSPAPAPLLPAPLQNSPQESEAATEFPAQVRRRSLMMREAGSLLFAGQTATAGLVSPVEAGVQDGEAAAEGGSLDETATATTTQTQGRNRLSQFTGSVGPLPFVSFLRKNVRDVTFVRDPEGCFYSLFEDPSKQLTDPQYLRMFVRRYLAHCCQGNNPHNIALRPFLVTRCGYVEPDAALVSRFCAEEMASLLKVDRDITQEQKRRTRLAERGLDSEGRPTGLFAQTGALFLTGLPQHTFFVAAASLFVVVVFAAYFGLAFGALANPVTLEVMTNKLVYLIVALVVSTGASAIAVLHTLQMRIPVRRHLCPFITRGITSLAALALCIVCGVALIGGMSKNTLSQTMINNVDTNSLCYFYLQQACSGYDVACPDTPYPSSECLCGFLFPYSTTPCQPVIDNGARVMFIPLILLSFMLAGLFVYLQLLLVSICTTERRLQNRPRRRWVGAA